MTPKEYFNKEILGRVTTRKIDDVVLDGNKTAITEEKEYEFIDIVIHDGEKIYITNEWDNEKEKAVFCIHNNFIKDINLNKGKKK